MRKKVLPKQRAAKPVGAPVAAAPEREEDPTDFTDLQVVRKALEDAFAEYRPPSPLDAIPADPWKKHPRDKRKRDGSRKLTPMEVMGKFTVDTCMRILSGLSISFFFTDACRVAGVTHKTGLEWVARGRKDVVGTPYWVFAHAVLAVSAGAKCRGIQTVQKTLARHVYSIEAAKVLLSWMRMRYPADFADQSKVDVTSKGQAVGGERLLRGINLVWVDAATATPQGHSVIVDGSAVDADDDVVNVDDLEKLR